MNFFVVKSPDSVYHGRSRKCLRFLLVNLSSEHIYKSLMDLSSYVPSEKMPETTFCMVSFIYILKKIIRRYYIYIYIFFLLIWGFLCVCAKY